MVSRETMLQILLSVLGSKRWGDDEERYDNSSYFQHKVTVLVLDPLLQGLFR